MEEDAPVLHVFESLRMRVGHEAPADLRCYRIDTVDEVVQGRRSPRAGELLCARTLAFRRKRLVRLPEPAKIMNLQTTSITSR